MKVRRRSGLIPVRRTRVRCRRDRISRPRLDRALAKNLFLFLDTRLAMAFLVLFPLFFFLMDGTVPSDGSEALQGAFLTRDYHPNSPHA